MSMKVPSTGADGAFEQDSFKYSPLEHVRSLFVSFFQGLFTASPRGAYHWDENDDLTEIIISSESVIKAEVLGLRPAITFTRSPVQFYTLGMDDMLAYNMATGTKRKAVLVPGTMVVNCSSRVQLESERIAWICAEQLWLHREMLMQRGLFEVGRQPSIGSPSPAGSIISGDQGDEWYVTAVTCPYQFYRTSQFSPLNKQILNSVQLSISTQLSPPVSDTVLKNTSGNSPESSDQRTLTTVSTRDPTRCVVAWSSRKNSPPVRPAGMGGRPIPIREGRVEQSSGTRMDPRTRKSVT